MTRSTRPTNTRASYCKVLRTQFWPVGLSSRTLTNSNRTTRRPIQRVRATHPQRLLNTMFLSHGPSSHRKYSGNTTSYHLGTAAVMPMSPLQSQCRRYRANVAATEPMSPSQAGGLPHKLVRRRSTFLVVCNIFIHPA